jgi:hypothetical protein
MSGGGISMISISFSAHAFARQHLAQEKEVDREAARDRDGACPSGRGSAGSFESVRTMITAPERWPSETILIGMRLSARSITSGASM